MRKLSIYAAGFFLSLSLSVRASRESYDFIQKYNDKKAQLKPLPKKVIAPTLYCSHMDLMIDQASPADLVPGLKADRIVISKSRRKMYLLNHGRMMHSYDVAFGFGSLEGAKSQAGDGRTPEGLYEIDVKKKDSSYHQALHVSYPNEGDIKFAQAHGVDPGDSIMIHGNPNQFTKKGARIDEMDGLDPFLIPEIHPRVDWTQGCVAVSNDEIEEIFDLADEHTAVEICALEKRVPIVQPAALEVKQEISTPTAPATESAVRDDESAGLNAPPATGAPSDDIHE